MSEFKCEVKTYKIDYICDICENGELESTGEIIQENPPKYDHKCNSCGEHAYMIKRYPYTTEEYGSEIK